MSVAAERGKNVVHAGAHAHHYLYIGIVGEHLNYRGVARIGSEHEVIVIALIAEGNLHSLLVCVAYHLIVVEVIDHGIPESVAVDKCERREGNACNLRVVGSVENFGKLIARNRRVARELLNAAEEIFALQCIGGDAGSCGIGKEQTVVNACRFAHFNASVDCGVVAAEYGVATLVDARFKTLDMRIVVLPYRDVYEVYVEAALEIVAVRLNLLTLHVGEVIEQNAYLVFGAFAAAGKRANCSYERRTCNGERTYFE